MQLGTPWVHQGLLHQRLRSIFPTQHTLENVKKQSNLRYPSGAYLELDAWIPDLNICFEFQDPYHYITAWFSHITKDKVQANDNTKVIAVRQQHITLIVVPCWWDGAAGSLAATIQFERPDLEVSSSNQLPIPMCPPLNFFKAPLVPEIGELMQASFPLDPKFSTFVPSNTWWVGEKYDGMRCCWSPQRQKIYTRAGRELKVLPRITKLLPKSYIDGEFFFGRGMFAFTYMLVKASFEFVCWDLLRLISFDVPSKKFRKKPFEERYEHLLTYVFRSHPFNIVAPRVLCKNSKHLNALVQEVIDDGGEGVIMRKLGSLYEHGRSPNLIKLKTSFGDQEGFVSAVQDDGTVVLKLPNGQAISVPSLDVLIPTPSVGSVVSFSFDVQSRRDEPFNPRIYRLREDLLWEDVVYHAMRDKKYLSDHLRTAGFSSQPPGYWTHKNMRNFLETFARSKGLDPLLAETWYKISPKEFRKFKRGATVVRKFSGYFKTIRQLFPNIGFDPKKMLHEPKWREIDNRRKFFEEYAAEKGFNPQIAENWYSQNFHSVMSKKGAYSVVAYHKHLLSQALIDLFPNIGVTKSRFWEKKGSKSGESKRETVPIIVAESETEQRESQVTRHSIPISWRDTATRRKFFEKYALSKGFNYDVASHWYLQPADSIMAFRGASKVISYHFNSIAQALTDLFPNVCFEISKFSRQLHSIEWYEVEKRRNFFIKYAQKRGFDPLVAANWHVQSKQALLSLPDIQSVISYHKGRISQALLDLFPDIGLDKSLLYTKSLWSDASDRRRFFESYAKANNFDPLVPEYWYNQPREKIISVTGAYSVINHHKSLSQAIVDLFPEVIFDKSKLWDRFMWNIKENRKLFFTQYASLQSFDPLVPTNWYLQPLESILAVKGASSVMSYHGNNVTTALLDLFPSIGLDPDKLWDPQLWRDANKRRKFFQNYAQSNSFDPSVLKNWSKEKLVGIKGLSNILAYHNHSLSQALSDLFHKPT